VQKVSADGLWRGSQLLEEQYTGAKPVRLNEELKEIEKKAAAVRAKIKADRKDKKDKEAKPGTPPKADAPKNTQATAAPKK
jgi:hypothetical protein